jgi:HlyD family secretion protein
MPTSPTLPKPSSRIVFLLLAWAAAGCNVTPTDEAAAHSKPVPVVQTEHPTTKTLHREIEQPARIEPFEQTPIQAKIAGFVDKVNVEIGSRVRKGDVLAELRVPEMEEELKLKTGLVAQAHLDITLAEKALRVAAAGCKTAAALVEEARAGRKRAEATLARWKSESARMTAMVRDRVLDVQSGEETVNQMRAAEAALDEVLAKIQALDAAREESVAKREKAEADQEATRNRLGLAEAEQRRVATLLDYTHITAPFDGVVSQRNVDTGHFLQPGSGSSGKVEPLFVVVRIDKVRVFLEVPEANAILVKCGRDGCAGRVRVPVLNDQEFGGYVAGTSWSLEPGQRTLRTEIDFDNTDGVLRPGMYAHALLEAEQPNAWTVPVTALVTRDGQTFCFLLVDGKAVRTTVRAGVREGTQVEVLKKLVRASVPGDKPRWENFTGTEDVITTRPGELTDGQVVQFGKGAEVAGAEELGLGR